MVRVEYVIEANDSFYREAATRYMRAERRRRLFAALRIGLGFLLIGMGLHLGAGLSLFPFLSGGIGALGAYVLLQPLGVWQYLRRVRSSPAFGRRAEIAVDGSGVHASDGIHESSITWEGCTRVIEFNDGLLCYYGKTGFRWLPHNAIVPPGEPGGAVELFQCVPDYRRL